MLILQNFYNVQIKYITFYMLSNFIKVLFKQNINNYLELFQRMLQILHNKDQYLIYE
jgi:hypothetical protein